MERPIGWVKAAQKAFLTFPDPVRDRVNTALTIAAQGAKADIAKPLRGLGSGVVEIAVRHRTNAWRVVYVRDCRIVVGAARVPEEVEDRNPHAEARDRPCQGATAPSQRGAVQMTQETEFELVEGTGNVFRDLGDPDAVLKHAKAVLAADVIATLDDSGLTVRKAAAATGFAAADFSRVRNANLGRFTVDRLVRMAAALQHAAGSSATARAHLPTLSDNPASATPRPIVVTINGSFCSRTPSSSKSRPLTRGPVSGAYPNSANCVATMPCALPPTLARCSAKRSTASDGQVRRPRISSSVSTSTPSLACGSTTSRQPAATRC